MKDADEVTLTVAQLQTLLTMVSGLRAFRRAVRVRAEDLPDRTDDLPERTPEEAEAEAERVTLATRRDLETRVNALEAALDALLPEHTFTVRLSRSQVAEVTVTAKDEDDAGDKALQMAEDGDVDWEEEDGPEVSDCDRDDD